MILVVTEILRLTDMKTWEQIRDEKLVEELKELLADPGISKGFRKAINRILADEPEDLCAAIGRMLAKF